jgi:cell division protein FtsA
MTKEQTIAAIDIGSSKVTTIIGSVSTEEEKVNIVGVANIPSQGLRKSQVVDIEDAINGITKSVEAAERMAGFSLDSALVSIGGSHIESQNSKGVVAVSQAEGEIVNSDVERVIEAARAISLPNSREILHVIPRDFMVDSQGGIKDPLGMTGVRLEVDTHIITGSSTAIRNISKCINELGIEVSGLVFSGLAASHSVLTDTEKELGVCLVDIGGGTTSIAVFVEGALAYSSVLPVGAKNITNDLAIGLRVSLDSAEKAKLYLTKKAEESKRNKDRKKEDKIDLNSIGIAEEIKNASYKTMVDGIIRPRLIEIFSMVGEKLDKAGLAGATPAGIVITGGGSLTVGIIDSAKRTLSLPVRLGEPTGLSGLIEDINSPRFAVARGLVMYGWHNSFQSEGRPSLPKIGGIVNKIPVKGAFNKVSNIVKSFLP